MSGSEVSKGSGDGLFHSGPIPLWMIDADELTFIDVNSAALQKFGSSRPEFLNHRVVDYFHDEDRTLFLDLLSSVRSETLSTEGLRLKRADSSLFESEIHIQRISDRRAYVLTIQDISERKRAEYHLRQAHGELYAFKRAINAASIVAITDGKGIIIEANDNFCSISGYRREELLGKNHRILNSSYHPKSFFTDLWKTISSGQVWQAEIRNKRKDGSFYWVDTTISPILDERNKPVRYLAIRNDITKRKEAEERVRHSENNLRALRDRMSPHFLFNTLSIIHSYLATNVETADAAILMLADSYRFLIDYSDKEMVNFDVEWAFMENYAKLIRLRHPDTIRLELSKVGHFGRFQIPPLTLQPFIENAYKHGIRNRRDGGFILANARVDGDFTEVTIRDNGIGLGEKDVFEGTLGSIAERLRYFLPQSTLTIENHPEGGVIVTLRFQGSSGAL